MNEREIRGAGQPCPRFRCAHPGYTSWPVYRGGPMFYADLIGPDKVLAKMKEVEATMGDDFKPAALLEKVVAEGKRFQDL
jgi:3-hydroxyacyl-CoA dehydrogenase